MIWSETRLWLIFYTFIWWLKIEHLPNVRTTHMFKLSNICRTQPMEFNYTSESNLTFIKRLYCCQTLPGSHLSTEFERMYEVFYVSAFLSKGPKTSLHSAFDCHLNYFIWSREHCMLNCTLLFSRCDICHSANNATDPFMS